MTDAASLLTAAQVFRMEKKRRLPAKLRAKVRRGRGDRSRALAALERGGRAEILPVGPDFAMYFKKTTQAVQRCKNQQQRWSYGRDRFGIAGTAARAETVLACYVLQRAWHKLMPTPPNAAATVLVASSVSSPV